MSYKQYIDLMIHKFNNGEEHNLIYMNKDKIIILSQQIKKKILMKYCLIGKMDYISLYRMIKIIKKIFQS